MRKILNELKDLDNWTTEQKIAKIKGRQLDKGRRNPATRILGHCITKKTKKNIFW